MMHTLIDHGSSHNLGDTAMLEGVLLRCLQSNPESRCEVIARAGMQSEMLDDPRVSLRHLDLEQPKHFDWLRNKPLLWRYGRQWSVLAHHRFMRAVRRGGQKLLWNALIQQLAEVTSACDALHVAGGGNLTDVFPGELWRRSVLIEAFKQQGKRVTLSGQQIGPFQSATAARIVRDTLRSAEFVGLRDPTESLDLCRQFDIPSDRVVVMGDDSFGLPAASETEADALLQDYNVKRGNFIAANVRVAKYAKDHDQHLRKIAELVTKLSTSEDLPVVVVPIALNKNDSDIHSGQRLAELCPPGIVTVVDQDNLNPALAKAILASASFAVGVSYHFCTFALSMAVPAVCIHAGRYYGQKAKGIARFWENEGLAMALDGLDSEAAATVIQKTVNDQTYRESLQSLSERSSNYWRETFDERILGLQVIQA